MCNFNGGTHKVHILSRGQDRDDVVLKPTNVTAVSWLQEEEEAPLEPGFQILKDPWEGITI